VANRATKKFTRTCHYKQNDPG